MNEHMYIYVLSVAVIHRPDTRNIRLPPIYEVVPNYFFNDDVLHKAYRIAMGDSQWGWYIIDNISDIRIRIYQLVNIK